MTTPELYQKFARYNRWMNEKFYDAAGALDDEARKQDRGAFFGSIHSTLDHILLGDRAWMNRLAGRDYALTSMGVDLFDDFDQLRAERAKMDEDIINWTDQLQPDFLGQMLSWDSGLDGETRSRPVWLLTSHMFNHQTHHRGQASTLLCQLGKDVGVTDLPWMDEA